MKMFFIPMMCSWITAQIIFCIGFWPIVYDEMMRNCNIATITFFDNVASAGGATVAVIVLFLACSAISGSIGMLVMEFTGVLMMAFRGKTHE